MSDDDEETRAYLQARMTVLFKMMFWAFAALIAFVWAQYTVYPLKAPHYRDVVYAGSFVGIVGMAIVWRGVLVRRQLSLRALYRLDLVYSSVTGLCFGASSYLQSDLHPAAYMALIYSGATVFARALIVPSSAARTAVASALTFLPMTVAAFGLAWDDHQELPGPAFFTGYLLLSSVPVILATLGSYIIYDLSHKIAATQQLGQYTLDRKIGEGGMGAVYRAHHVMLRRLTAIKLLLPDRIGAASLARFEREVQEMSQLSHPNTVAVYDYGRSSDGLFYYAMEYLGGGIDLEQLVKRHGKQPIGRVIRILAQACGALQEAHDRKLVHRDIKPANIILCERGGMPDVVKVVDFGLVKELQGETGTTTQVVLGTPAYIAPEAVTDPANVGPAADLYALGCVGYFLLTGKRVFDARTEVELCIQHVRQAPASPNVGAELDAIILRCLAKQPADRFESATALAEALRAVPVADWDLAKAREWWSTIQVAQTTTELVSAAPTRTITVDLSDGVRFA